ncbi:MAG TPA: DUF1127 domain-containing protein [Roseiarcus sp.]|nr:DUF1127 domain-containing protein [Roseiarcus sp.]
MMSSLVRRASHGVGALKRALSWPARISAERRAMSQLAGMSDREFSDIGLVRQDVVDASALRLDADRSAIREGRRPARQPSACGRRRMAA